MLIVSDITRKFGNLTVLNRIDLSVKSGEIVCLLGASGSGKTTLLRIIAGLETADSGDVLLDERSILNIPAHRRDFGLMFQDFALFPHLNVEQNVAFGLRMRGVNSKEQHQRVAEVLSLVGLSGFDRRDVASLSGGERQRVALARSLAPSPKLLLLDEPLGSLDASLRERLATELREIIKNTGLTAIHVTHDQQEAFAIADRIAILHRGQIEQIDTPERLYHRPKTVYAAQFLGLNNIVHGGVLKSLDLETDAKAVLLHPEGIRLDAQGEISGTVRECVFMGDAYRLLLEHENGVTLTFKVPSRYETLPQVGEQVRVSIAPDSIIGLDESSEIEVKMKRLDI